MTAPSPLPPTDARSPVVWLRFEGLVVLVLAVLLYAREGHSWLLFGFLFFSPDVSIAGYAAGPRLGALCYNAMHSYIGPLIWTTALLATGKSLGFPIIWIAHIGFDRMLGFGLKYPTGFADTHLGRVGLRRPADRAA